MTQRKKGGDAEVMFLMIVSPASGVAPAGECYSSGPLVAWYGDLAAFCEFWWSGDLVAF
jgi:hypothetical protein